MARPGRPKRNKATRSFRQLRRFHHAINSDKVFGTHRAFDLDVLAPGVDDRRVVHDIIYKELVVGEVRPESRTAYREIIGRLVAQGAQAIILGCTEIMLLVSDEDSAVPLFDTTTIHAIAAVDRALASGN